MAEVIKYGCIADEAFFRTLEAHPTRTAVMEQIETVLYTCALYLAAAGVKKSRYIIPASLLGWIVDCAVAGCFFRA